MSWAGSGPVIVKDEVKAELQLILFESVLGDRPESRKEVLRILTNKDKIPLAKKSVLDFTFAQANDCKELKETKKLSLVGKLKYKAYSPLMVAVEENNYRLAEELLDAGASVAFKNKDRRTALHIACKMGFPDMVKLLLESAKKQSVFNRQLLQYDCKLVINAKHKPNGWTPLMYAVLGGHVEVVRVLMKFNDLNLKEVNAVSYVHTQQKQQNVFQIAAREGKMECLKVLCSDKDRELEVKIAVASMDQKGRNILHHACTRSNVELLDWLLQTFETLRSEQFLNLQSMRSKKKFKKDGEIIEVEAGEYTPFLVACEYKKLDIVKYLMTKVSLDILMQSACYKNGRKGITALHLAAVHDDEELTKHLVESFAAHCKATRSGDKVDDTHQMNADHGEDLADYERQLLLDIKDEKGDTVLHIARASSSRRVAKYVCEKCKDLESVKNKDGELPPEERVYFIPPEIEDIGKAAVEAYMKALDEGECKIPYYSMLILGEQRVGKTSLYRQLVGKPFIENLNSTKEAIDNNTVETVDARNITLGQEGQSSWKEVKLHPTNSFANAITEDIRHMPEIQKEKEGSFVARGEGILVYLIKKLDTQLVPPPPRPKTGASITHQLNQQKIDPVPEYAFYDKLVTVAPQPVKPPSSKGVREPLQPLPEIEKPVEESWENVAVKQKDVCPHASPIVETFSAPLSNVSPVPPKLSPPSDPVKVEEEKEELQIEENGRLNKKLGISVTKKLQKKNKKKESENPELTLNTLEFAGHAEFRPMHQFLISRRACYLVVFKIPELLENKGKKENVHFEEIRYWIHSINAHIYPPEKDKNNEDKTISRVILVGTHSEAKSEEDLNSIEKLLNKLRWDRRCVNHLIELKSLNPACPYNNFIPVENSYDIEKTKDQYLKKSGTDIVQESIKKLFKKLPFLNEDYPIKWLNFKERIEAMESSSPVITMEELISLAEKSLLTNDQLKGQDAAIRFLHDSGKIRCLKYLPCLFLHDDQMDQLMDKVIIHPLWLITVMRKIVELDYSKDREGVRPASLQDLSVYGIADKHLLEKCWKQELEACGNLKLNHLCFVLQAYCLIFPIESKSPEEQPGQSESTDCSQRYLIPCKLPLTVDVSRLSDDYSLFDFKIYFDFEKFLPAEVYHRFVCRLIMLADREDSKNVFTQAECIIHHVKGWDWWVEHKALSHTLEISIKGCEHLVEDFECAHDLMVEVCKGSELKRLTYKGGCHEKCIRCKQDGLLICMTFNEGNGKMVVREDGTGSQCSTCKKRVDLYGCCKKVTIGQRKIDIDVAGFVISKEVELEKISLPYKGNSFSFIWKGYGLQLYCDEEYLSTEAHFTIKLLGIASNVLILPEDFEAVSGLYFISCSCKFTKPVTIRIQHCATESSLEHLVFATSLDRTPPFRLHCIEGKFDSNSGELKVTSFSPFIILLRRLYSWLFGSMSYSISYSISYSTYLYHSYKYEENSITYWDLNFFIVKKLQQFESLVERNAENMHLSGSCIVEFNKDVQEISFEPRNIRQYSNLRVCSITNQSISKDVIDRYGEGYPPSYKFQLINSNPKVQRIEIQFYMKGVREPQNFIRFVWPIASSSIIRGISGSQLSEADLATIYDEIFVARVKWYNVGLALGVPVGTLEAIEAEPSVDIRLRKMLQTWLRQGQNQTWIVLAEVLGKATVGHTDLMHTLKNKYCSNL